MRHSTCSTYNVYGMAANTVLMVRFASDLMHLSDSVSAPLQSKRNKNQLDSVSSVGPLAPPSPEATERAASCPDQTPGAGCLILRFPPTHPPRRQPVCAAFTVFCFFLLLQIFFEFFYDLIYPFHCDMVMRRHPGRLRFLFACFGRETVARGGLRILLFTATRAEETGRPRLQVRLCAAAWRVFQGSSCVQWILHGGCAWVTCTRQLTSAEA